MSEHLPDGFPTDYIPDPSEPCRCSAYPEPHIHNVLYSTAAYNSAVLMGTSTARDAEEMALDREASRRALAQLRAHEAAMSTPSVLSWCLDHVGQLMGVALLIALFSLALAFR